MPSPAEYETETSGNSPTAAPACSLAHPHAQPDRELLAKAHAHSKLVRQNSVRAESSEAEITGNLTPEIVIIKNGTLSRSCTEETERIGDSAQEIYSPSTTDNNNETTETKFDFEDEDDVLSAQSASSLTGVVIGDRLGDGGISRLHGGAGGGLVRSSSEHLEHEAVSKFEFEVFETETPSRGVSTVFICLYTAIGATILTMIVLTVVFDFGMMMLLGMTAIIFIIIVILTNMCTMVYQL